MDEREQQAERPHELHDFGETPQVVFLLLVSWVYVRPSNGKSCGYVRGGRPGPGMAGSYLYDRIAALRSAAA